MANMQIWQICKYGKYANMANMQYGKYVNRANMQYDRYAIWQICNIYG